MNHRGRVIQPDGYDALRQHRDRIRPLESTSAIHQITSLDGSITITNPVGPTADLSVVAGKVKSEVGYYNVTATFAAQPASNAGGVLSWSLSAGQPVLDLSVNATRPYGTGTSIYLFTGTISTSASATPGSALLSQLVFSTVPGVVASGSRDWLDSVMPTRQLGAGFSASLPMFDLAPVGDFVELHCTCFDPSIAVHTYSGVIAVTKVESITKVF